MSDGNGWASELKMHLYDSALTASTVCSWQRSFNPPLAHTLYRVQGANMDTPNTLSLTQNGSAKISRVIRLEDKQVEEGTQSLDQS